MRKATVLGARGFIGSHLVRRLDSLGVEHEAPSRDEDLRGRDLGTVFDCAGLTADFRCRPLDAVDAHVCRVEHLLRNCRADSLVYLSSIRLYRGGVSPVREEDAISFRPGSADDLYNASKAAGEALTLTSHPQGRVVRLAHVYGADFHSENFLSTVLRDVIDGGEITLRTALDSTRDFISVDDVVGCLIEIASSGRHRIYNVASGREVSNRKLAARLTELTGCRVSVAPGAPPAAMPAVSVDRVREEFGFEASNLLADLPELIALYRDQAGRAHVANE